jgi:hypothetical protein
MYSSALSSVEQVDVWAKDIKLEGIALNQFNACKGELLELARSQVRYIRSCCAVADILVVGRHWDTHTPFAV